VGDIRGDNRAISILISKSKYCLKIFNGKCIIIQNCLISDQMFLRRVAKIASNDGMNIQQHGGIWKVIMLLVMTSEGKGAMHK
jgi:ribosomal protein L19